MLVIIMQNHTRAGVSEGRMKPSIRATLSPTHLLKTRSCSGTYDGLSRQTPITKYAIRETPTCPFPMRTGYYFLLVARTSRSIAAATGSLATSCSQKRASTGPPIPPSVLYLKRSIGPASRYRSINWTLVLDGRSNPSEDAADAMLWTFSGAWYSRHLLANMVSFLARLFAVREGRFCPPSAAMIASSGRRTKV